MLEIQACDVVLSFVVLMGMLAFLWRASGWSDERFDEVFGVRHGRR